MSGAIERVGYAVGGLDSAKIIVSNWLRFLDRSDTTAISQYWVVAVGPEVASPEVRCWRKADVVATVLRPVPSKHSPRG